MEEARPPEASGPQDHENRWRKLQDLEDRLETPTFILSLVWLGLLVLEFTRGLSPPLEALGTGIWLVFLLDFALRFSLAPEKGAFLKANVLTALSLIVPALRIFRAARVLRLLRLPRAARGLRLAKTLGSIGRGMRTLRARLGRRRLGFVLSATVVLDLVGAAAMLAFEKDVPDPRGLHDYGTSLWWTSMVLTTMGSEYWPKTPEGRFLTLFLAVYAFAFFGYVTAALATLFIGEDRAGAPDESSTASALRDLERELRRLRDSLGSPGSPSGQGGPRPP
jgi:voltage-gated potassium channel